MVKSIGKRILRKNLKKLEKSQIGIKLGKEDTYGSYGQLDTKNSYLHSLHMTFLHNHFTTLAQNFPVI